MENEDDWDRLEKHIDADMYRAGIDQVLDQTIKGMRDAQWDQPEYILVNEETYRWITDQVLPDVCSPAGLKKLFPALKG